MSTRYARISVNGTPKIVDLLKGLPLTADGLLSGYSNVVVRGGGFIAGINTGSGTLYARTDVGGAYRYDPTSDHWTQLINSSSITSSPDPSDYQVEGLAAAPTNSNIVYATVGSSSGGTMGRFLRSTNGGSTWTANSRVWYIGGNEGGREGGNRITIDPSNANVVYVGTRKNGIQMSTDGGVTFTSLSTPATIGDSTGTGAVGINNIYIDPTSSVSSGRRQTIWATVYGVGLIRSTDGGSTWSTIYTFSAGYFRDLIQASAGILYGVAFSTTASNAKVIRINNTTVTDITPNTANRWASVAVDPFNPDLVIVADQIVNGANRVFRTTNGTSTTPTWTSLGITIANGNKGTVWPTQTTDIISSMANGQMRILNGRLWFGEGMGVWSTTSYSGSSITWQHTSDGIEELVANVAYKPAGGQLLTASWDRGIFRHPKPYKQLPLTGQAANLPYTTGFGAAWDINSCISNPSFVVAILDDSQDVTGVTYPARRASGWSLDGGVTWSRFQALTSGTAPANLLLGNICPSSGSVNNIVWIPSNLSGNSTAIYYTNDRGVTWTAATLNGLTTNDFLHDNYTKARRILVADPANNGTFYALGGSYANSSATIWKSTDGGATWNKITTSGLNPPSSSTFVGDSHLIYAGSNIFAIPGNTSTAFYRSTDGVNWTVRTNLTNAFGFGVGAAMTNGGNPALYTFATVGSTTGLYRSIDFGDTWSYLAGYPNGLYQSIRHISGDPSIAGRVYIALGGNGFVAGQFS